MSGRQTTLRLGETAETAVADKGRSPAAVRIVFGVIWGIAAWLKWQPGFRATSVPKLIAKASAGPHWLAPWFDFWVRLERPAPGLLAFLSQLPRR